MDDDLEAAGAAQQGGRPGRGAVARVHRVRVGHLSVEDALDARREPRPLVVLALRAAPELELDVRPLAGDRRLAGGLGVADREQDVRAAESERGSE